MRFLALLGVVLAFQTSGAFADDAIRLRSGIVHPATRRRTALGHHFVLQFRTNPGPETRAELMRRGVRILGYVPDSALMVSSPAAPDLTGLDVTWAGSLSASDKLSPELARFSPTAYVVIFHADVSRGQAMELVQRRGLWTQEHPDLLPGHLLVSGSYGRILELAGRDEVAYVLPASTDLVAGRRVMACAGAMTEAGPVGEYVEVSSGWAKSADGRVGLNYVFQSFTSKMDENAVRGEVARALGEWARYTRLDFSQAEGVAAARTITILFARGAHGDGYPFDGPGGVLAHTFYPAPPNDEPIAGDMHLDADENWRVGANIDLFSVALHEAGHALGLGHTSQPGSVMFPYYHQLSGLSDDDIAGIRDLYGSNESGPPVAPVQPPVESAPQPPPQPAPASPGKPPATPDRTPPSLRIVSPGSTIVATQRPAITLTGTAIDDVGVTAVEWTNSTGGSGTASGTAYWSAQVPLLVGTNTVIVRAYDAAGNSGWRAVTVVRR